MNFSQFGGVPQQVGLSLFLQLASSPYVANGACKVVSVVYPAYGTIDSIFVKEDRSLFKKKDQFLTNTKKQSSEDEPNSTSQYNSKKVVPRFQKSQQDWLKYWLVYGSITFVESLFDQQLGQIPYYYHGKFIFAVWLLMPQTQGANKIYTNVVAPFYKRYYSKFNQISQFMGDYLGWLLNTYGYQLQYAEHMVTFGYHQIQHFVEWFISKDQTIEYKDQENDAQEHSDSET